MIHIPLQKIVDYPITGYIEMEILSVVVDLVHHHREKKHCPSAGVNMIAVHHNGALSSVWLLHTLSPLKHL